MELVNPNDCPYYLISRASLIITSVLKKGFAAAGVDAVNPSYLGVLMSLWNWCDFHKEDNRGSECIGPKTNKLARLAGLEPSTMTGLLDRMERNNLIVRTAVPDDRRAQYISLTEKGKKIREMVLIVVEQTLVKAFNGISESDLDHMKDILRKVLANNRET